MLGGYNLFSLVGVTKVCLEMSYLSPRGRRIRDYPDILSKFHDVVHANEYSQTTNPQVHNITVTNDFIKLWPGDASLQNQNLRTGLQWVASSRRSQSTKRQMTCDQLVSTCVGWPKLTVKNLHQLAAYE